MYAFCWDFLTRDQKNNKNATNAALTNHGDAFCKQTIKVGMSVMSLKSNWSDYDVHVIKSKFYTWINQYLHQCILLVSNAKKKSKHILAFSTHTHYS